MKSYALCPVTNKRIDEHVARITGFFNILLLIIAAITLSIIPVVFLAADFFLRSTDFSRYSLVGISSGYIVRYLGLDANYINAGPKIFAARLGLILSILIILSFLLKFYLLAVAISGILGLFAFLETALGICVACELYPYVHRLLYKVS